MLHDVVGTNPGLMDRRTSMVLVSRHVSTSFRLSHREAALIRPGLMAIRTGYDLWRETGSPSCSPAKMLFQRTGVDEGEYDAKYLATVCRVIVATTFPGRSGRLKLDCFELAACLLGVRVTETLVRH